MFDINVKDINVKIIVNLNKALDALGSALRRCFNLSAEREKELISSCKDLNLQGVHALLKKRININARDERGRTLLLIASSKGERDSVDDNNFHLVKLLLDSEPKPDVEAKDHYGNTALIMASRNGNRHIIKALIDAGADVNAQNDVGWTGLMRAANRGYLKTVKLLLDEGADKNILNNDGEKAIDIVRKNANKKNVSMEKRKVFKKLEALLRRE